MKSFFNRFRSSSLLTSSLVAASGAFFCGQSDSSSFSVISKSYCEEKIGSFCYAANNPIEDRMIFGKGSGWTYTAVFDGHGGWQVADDASKEIMAILLTKLNNISPRNELLLDRNIIDSFQDMENKLLQKIRSAFQAGNGGMSSVGSCVIIALKKENNLVIANCGDCRAVLGSEVNSRWYATIINRDHNCRVPFEQHFLQQHHPNESNLVICQSAHACYVKGRLQLTRSLGDVYLKYPEFNGSPEKGRMGGRYIPNPYTPPYVLHTPDIHHIRLQSQDRFLILGSDGLWDYLPADEAVNMVQYGMKMKLSADEIGKRLVARALTIAGEECGLTFEQLLRLPPGRSRRGVHDDTTAVVLFF